MSGPVKSLAYKHYQRAFARWPKDALRPECQLQDVLAKRLESRFTAPGAKINEGAELRQVNALYSLLDDRYKAKYKVSIAMTEPLSNPTYYADLMSDLEEAPKRSWLDRLGKRLGGLIRFS
ncbi:hypothetical protein NKR23_g5855 [Pleurostoma richardsiae]|uniref:Ubiquinol-cytochrome-c reductase complex assembly factor 2 n=1 Tax=Pleurostoma richardsiae TaxID=41990 RepID=A0AA38RFW7_9PEZI|nr:hypothetical protein NKR23_g5855 [Pleurostoma richardsiae]